MCICMMFLLIAGCVDSVIGYENDPCLTEISMLYHELFADLCSDRRLA